MKPELEHTVDAPSAGSSRPLGRYRWSICALLFFATTINYMDRQVLGLLAPVLQNDIGWNEIQYGNIVFAFSTAYAIGLLVVGGLIDKLGTRIGYALAIGVWSLASMGHALAHSVFGFGVARASLGLGESGNFPAAIKTVTVWFPRKERAYATGIFNSGANIGAILAPLFVPWITIHYGWRLAFVLTGVCGLPWIILWLRMYRLPREHPTLSAEELAYIESDPPDTGAKIPWLRLLDHRQTWAVMLTKFLTDPIWWFYLYWLPKFLNTEHGLTIDKLGLPLVAIYLVSDAGSIFGGWLSSYLIRRGVAVNRARKMTMLLFCGDRYADCLRFKGQFVMGRCRAGLYRDGKPSGMVGECPTRSSPICFRNAPVASVTGLAGFGGAVGGMVIAKVAGSVLQLTHSYLPLFMIAGSSYLIAFALLQVLAPRLQPVAAFAQAAESPGA